jgi:glyoxylase-like metal-dependent hydrolase (beta-lactamase superfamily II)
MEIYPQLHWLKGSASNAYLYDEGDTCVLVDLGMPGQIDVVGYLRKIGRKPDDLSHILITHADIDHIGNVAALQQETGAVVYAGQRSRALLQDGKMPSHGWEWFNWTMHRLYQYEPVEAQPLGNGETLSLLGGLTVIDTPGHTPDHVAFYSQATGILFSGDALHTRGGTLSESGRFISADYALAKQSAAKLLNLSPAVFAPGHGEPLQTHSDDALMLLYRRLNTP